jgi:hypothetical protein
MSLIEAGSLVLRKIAEEKKRSLTAKLVGAGVSFAKKHPALTTTGLVGAALVPGMYRKWKPRVEQVNPYSPQNIYESNYWER